MTPTAHRLPAILLTALPCLAAGCGPSLPPTAAVHGRVLLDGRPAAGVSVEFVQQGAARHAGGLTDTAGNFSLTTFAPGDGALLGEHRVTIFQPAMPPPDLADAPFPTADLAEQAEAGESCIPAVYSDSQTTPLGATVVEGENHFDFRLSSEAENSPRQ